ncbi:MAG: class I SAM-dependent methyltransferase, partial [Candidatus Omnitrophota bacterium]|nr:class I SAM-dependent methyltransferase [Candidatus Omnitrophota bacterium]
MRCADIGCGMTAFTIYLKKIAQCEAVGVDPDVFFDSSREEGWGVTPQFVRRTGLKIVQSKMEMTGLASNSVDRVFCLSVIEHLPREVAQHGIQEMARILKPEGIAVLTVDTNLLSGISRPLDLIWDSGLIPLGEMDLCWPTRRFGNYCDGRQPADVFGMTLVKKDFAVETQYSGPGGRSPVHTIPAYRIPVERELFERPVLKPRPLWRRAGSRVKRAARVLFHG